MQSKSSTRRINPIGIGVIGTLWLLIGWFVVSQIINYRNDQEYARVHTVPTDHYFCQNLHTHFIAKQVPHDAIEFGSAMTSTYDPTPVCFRQDAAGRELDLFCTPNHMAHYYDVSTAPGERYSYSLQGGSCENNPAAR